MSADESGSLVEGRAEDWEGPERPPASPTLHLDGFDGPMDLLLDLAERQRIDFGRMSVLDLAGQFVTAMDCAEHRVPLERRADWLVLATRLVLLRSRLLFPETPQVQAQAEQEAEAELRLLETRVFIRQMAAQLGARPQLGLETFARPRRTPRREGGYVALMEACLTVLRGRERDSGGGEQVYRPTIPNLWRVPDAMARIGRLLALHPEGGSLAAFLPPTEEDDPEPDIRARTAVASTLLAALELAREGNLTIIQPEPMATCWIRILY